MIISRINKLDENSAAAEVFSDYGIISSYAKGGVGSAAKAEIAKGYNDNTFKPQNPITRAEAIVILDRAIGAGSEQAEDLTVDKSGTTVENVTVKNIHITDKVGSGEVTLKNVKVTGELLVEGGGQNSIIIENSDIKNLTVDKADGKVRILLKGSSSVGSTTLESGATLEQKDLKGDGFGDVEISKDANTKHTVIITADVDNLNVNAKIKINVKSGTIGETVVLEKAAGVTVNLSKSVVVKSQTINAKAEFTGTGTIEKAYVNVNGVTFEQKPKTMTVAKGIDEPKIVESSTGGGGSGGGGGNGGSDPEVPEKYTVSAKVDPKDAGRVKGTGSYAKGDVVTLTAIATEGYEFVNWTDVDGDVVSSENPYIFTVESEDVSLTANFKAEGGEPDPEEYTVSAKVDPKDAGTVTGTGIYAKGAVVTLTAIAAEGYEFKNWTDVDGKVVSSDNPYIFKVGSEDVFLTANFKVEGGEPELEELDLKIVFSNSIVFVNDTDYNPHIKTINLLIGNEKYNYDDKKDEKISLAGHIAKLKNDFGITLKVVSEDPEVLNINETTGIMTGVKVGDASVTVTASKSGYKNISFKFSVTVEEAPEPVYATLTVLQIGDKDVYEEGVKTYPVTTTQSAITITAITSTGTAISVTSTGTGITGTAISVTPQQGTIDTVHVINVPLSDEVDACITLSIPNGEGKSEDYIIKITKGNSAIKEGSK